MATTSTLLNVWPLTWRHQMTYNIFCLQHPVKIKWSLSASYSKATFLVICLQVAYDCDFSNPYSFLVYSFLNYYFLQIIMVMISFLHVSCILETTHGAYLVFPEKVVFDFCSGILHALQPSLMLISRNAHYFVHHCCYSQNPWSYNGRHPI